MTDNGTKPNRHCHSKFSRKQLQWGPKTLSHSARRTRAHNCLKQLKMSDTPGPESNENKGSTPLVLDEQSKLTISNHTGKPLEVSKTK